RPAPGAPNERWASASGRVLRRWGRADANPTFQLYNRWTPEPVRRVEAATFREWLAGRERASSARRTGRAVVEGEGRIVGWLRTVPDGEVGRFEVMADPSMPELMDALIDTALVRLREQSVLFSLVPEFATGLRERLLRRGFVPTEEFAVLARRTALPEPVPQLAPATPA
ncbi:MAG: hypothetical protein U1B78_02315, partial [Dehalococcoidia bacterium]|nr:hypothetical protein [Dehalococcoidia bacterium]